MLRKWAAVTAAAAMLMSGPMAFAGTGKQQQPKQQQSALAPGKAAGVEKAEAYDTNVMMIVLGVGVVVGGVALALAGSGGGSSSSPSTH